MFKIGDYVVHYKEGVCEVIDIGKLDMRCSDKNKEYYTLKPLYDVGGTVYTPVDNEIRQIRGIISAEEAKELMDHLREVKDLQILDEKKREALYKEALLSNQCQNWAAVIKTTYSRRKKRLSCGKKAVGLDERYLVIAERFLTGELAAALEVPRDKVKEYLVEKIND
ncbi:MAG TPA: CarD family transcriptional regulator [Candidatus Dorea gallistercoris]|uniref:CarD family transcriptional regulator n=1 Tax=Candidatus Dorea gallistercoris TaxID=2838542 RepID=A0A9D1UDV7_9FIRM|nr:CarD family transcriptional regulator [Candidatus Dorea gallistercoris]